MKKTIQEKLFLSNGLTAKNPYDIMMPSNHCCNDAAKGKEIVTYVKNRFK